MQEYRRRFIALNLSLIGAVLLAVLVITAAYITNGYRRELDMTMRQVLEPVRRASFAEIVRPSDFDDDDFKDDDFDDDFNPQGGAFRPENDGFERENVPPALRESGGEKSRILSEDKKITVITYTADDGINIITQDSDIADSDLVTATGKVLALGGDRGRLSEPALLYSKAVFSDVTAISFAPSSYITSYVLKLALVFAAVFLAAMVLFYFVARYISGLAVKPLEKSREMEKQFVDDISHDLKTPITVILANNSILKQNASESVESQMQWVDSTGDSAKNMLGMIDEMLTLSQMDSPSFEFEKQRVDFSSAVFKAAYQMESAAYEKGIYFDYEGIEDNVFVEGSAEFAGRITSGLISNAVKYEPEGGEIMLCLIKEKKSALLTVANKKAFINEADIGRIFDRFYRSDKSRTGAQGHGLGLSIAKRMTDLMGGDIEVTSSPESGTCFTVTLPLA